MKKHLAKDIWVEEFRPSNLKLVVMPKEDKEYFRKLIEEKQDIPNLLFLSPLPGSGKTTIAKILIQALNMKPLFIHSPTAKMDDVRNRLPSFCMGASKTRKVVVFDEADGLKKEVQKSLLPLIEEYKNVRFIFTANSIGKLSKTLISRTQMITFNWTAKDHREELIPQFSKMMKFFLKKKKIEADGEVVDQLVEKHWPDMRFITQKMEYFADKYGRIYGKILTEMFGVEEITHYIKTKSIFEIRELILNNNLNPEEVYHYLWTRFLDEVPTDSWGDIIEIVSEATKWNDTVSNPEIVMADALNQIKNVLK